MQSDDERRFETRLDETVTIVIELEAAAYDQSAQGKILISNTSDISPNGVKVEFDSPVPCGSILQLCAQMPPDGKNLRLVGEVKWCRPEGECYSAGFELFDSEDTDIVAWKECVAHLL